MAPILSLPKESLDRIRKAVALAVVSIWQVDDSSGSKVSFRSGFVFDCENNACIVLTLKKDLDRSRKLFVQFENGKCFEGLTTFGDEKSNLVAIEVIGLGFEPKKVILSEHNADQCDEVVHMGIFDEENLKLNFSSGSVWNAFENLIYF
ncbi:hypothetical protein C2845_PM05G05220 [Panicum miliaceum]|uniref:Uncharacterized protein n=1 Tax=Panicum miliaceum TaxID=4540 RepID=A0A3L6T0V3_PANMI|nr:hypothetical protein C2845_PM05G05220 [Panicum miliaceum]